MNHLQDKRQIYNDNNRVYCGIDLVKLICAMLVVLLHTIEGNNSWYSNEIKYVFTSFAVPFFFLVSGFMFCRGVQRAENPYNYFLRYERKLLKIYFIWAVVIYLPFELNTYLNKYNGSSIFRIALLLLRRYILIGPGPYWYIWALLLSIVFIYYCIVNNKDRLLLIMVLMGLLVEIMYTGFRHVLSGNMLFDLLFNTMYYVFSGERNFILYGIPFVGIGCMIYKYEIQFNKRLMLLCFIVASILAALEYYAPIHNDSFGEIRVSFAFIIQAICLFMYSLKMNIEIDYKESISIRQLSSTIFYSHFIFLFEVVNPCILKYTILPYYADWMIIIKMLITLIMCYSFYFIIKSINKKKLNVLING